MGKDGIELKSIAGKTGAGKKGILRNRIQTDKYLYCVKSGSEGDVYKIENLAKMDLREVITRYGLTRSKKPVGSAYYIFSSKEPFYYSGGGGEFSFRDEDSVEMVEGTLKGAQAKKFLAAIPPQK